MGASRSVCVLADHTKVGIVGLSTFMALDEVDTLITDAGVPSRARGILEESVDHLLLAAVADAHLTSARQAGDVAKGGRQ